MCDESYEAKFNLFMGLVEKGDENNIEEFLRKLSIDERANMINDIMGENGTLGGTMSVRDNAVRRMFIGIRDTGDKELREDFLANLSDHDRFALVGVRKYTHAEHLEAIYQARERRKREQPWRFTPCNWHCSACTRIDECGEHPDCPDTPECREWASKKEERHQKFVEAMNRGRL